MKSKGLGKKSLSILLCLAMLISNLFVAKFVTEAEEPVEIIVDNTDTGFTKNGDWVTSTYRSNYYGSNYYSVSTGENISATWTPEIETPGYYNIYVWHSTVADDSTIDNNARYEIKSAGSVTDVYKSQRNAGGEWELLACKKLNAGTSSSVTLHLDTQGLAIMADAVKFTLVTADDDSKCIFVDDSNATFVDDSWASSTWRAGYYGSGYRSISESNAQDPATASATWTPVVPSAGYYNVYVRHPEGSGDETISDSVPYTIRHAFGTNVVRLNQREQGMGGQWRMLGCFRFNAGTTGSIQLTLDGVGTGKAVMADAIKLEPVSTIEVNDTEFTASGVADWATTNDDSASGGSYQTMEA